MNNRQRIAFYNPCNFPSQRTGRIYNVRLEISGLTVASCLTLDAFRGAPVWHVSGSVLNERGKPVNLYAKIPRTEAKTISEHLKALLEGVGRGEISTQNSPTELNFYKYGE